MAEISKTTDQALLAMLALSDHGPMTAAEVARKLGLNRTVVYRLLTTLHQRGFVVRQDGGAYAPGILLVRMAARVQPELRAAAARVMRELSAETGETTVLHIPDDLDAVVLEQVVGTAHVVRVQHEIGSRHALARGASGRALLAFLEKRVIDRAMATEANPEALARHLEAVRQMGYAVSHDELQAGVHGVAAPVQRGGVAVASLAILTPTNRAQGITENVPAIVRAADAIAGLLVGS